MTAVNADFVVVMPI